MAKIIHYPGELVCTTLQQPVRELHTLMRQGTPSGAQS
jgi:hypothetical protein